MAEKKTPAVPDYDESSIQQLEGLEAVRKRSSTCVDLFCNSAP